MGNTQQEEPRQPSSPKVQVDTERLVQKGSGTGSGLVMYVISSTNCRLYPAREERFHCRKNRRRSYIRHILMVDGTADRLSESTAMLTCIREGGFDRSTAGEGGQWSVSRAACRCQGPTYLPSPGPVGSVWRERVSGGCTIIQC